MNAPPTLDELEALAKTALARTQWVGVAPAHIAPPSLVVECEAILTLIERELDMLDVQDAIVATIAEYKPTGVARMAEAWNIDPWGAKP